MFPYAGRVERLRDLEVRHLVALDAVARLGTFGRAADELGYTQSAISQQIARLERMLGAPVFDRPGGPRPVTLTPLGLLVLDHARAILGRVRTADVDVESFLAGASGRLRVGTFESVSTNLVPRIIGPLLETIPGLDLELVGSDELLVPWLREGQIDLSFMVGENGEPGEFETVHLLDDPYVLVTRAGSGWPKRADTHRLGELALIADPTESRFRIDPALRALGVEPNYAFRSHENGAMLAMVKAGLGAAITPRLSIDRLDPELEAHELRPALPRRRVLLAWRAGRTLSPVAERFVAQAVATAAQLRGASTRAGRPDSGAWPT